MCLLLRPLNLFQYIYLLLLWPLNLFQSIYLSAAPSPNLLLSLCLLLRPLNIFQYIYLTADMSADTPTPGPQQVGGASQAVLDRSSSGPLFGPEGLHVPLDPDSERAASSRLGSYYERMPGSKSLFAAEEPGGGVKRGKAVAQLTQLKVEWVLDGH